MVTENQEPKKDNSKLLLFLLIVGVVGLIFFLTHIIDKLTQ